MAKKFIPAGIEVQRHLDAFVHVGCISRVFKSAGIDPHRTKGKEHRVYSKDGKTYWLLFDVLCHGFLTEFNINGRYLRAVLERPSLNLYILDMRFPYKITDELEKGNLTGEETYRELIEHFTIKWWDGAEFSKLLHNNQVKFNDL